MHPEHEVFTSEDPNEIAKGRLWKVTSRYGKESYVFFNAYSEAWMQESMSCELSMASKGNKTIFHLHEDQKIVDQNLQNSDSLSGLLLAMGAFGLKYLHVTNRLNPFWFTYANIVESKTLQHERKKLDKELGARFANGNTLECLDFRHNHPDNSLQQHLKYNRYKVERVYETPDVLTLYRPLWQVGIGCAFVARALPRVGGLFAPISLISCGLASALAQDTIMSNKPPEMAFLHAARRSMEYSYARLKGDWEGLSLPKPKINP